MQSFPVSDFPSDMPNLSILLLSPICFRYHANIFFALLGCKKANRISMALCTSVFDLKVSALALPPSDSISPTSNVRTALYMA